MNFVPGIPNAAADRLELERAPKGRVQTPGLRAQNGLRPVASPVDTFVRPAAAPQDNAFLALSRGLAAVNPAVGRFVEGAAQEAQPAAEAAATRKLGGMTFEEARDAMKAGKISELQNPWFKAAWMKQFGQRYALWRSQKLGTDYDNEFDKDKGNVDELIAKGAKEDLDAFGDDKHFVAGYQGASQGFHDKLRMADAQYKSDKLKADTQQGVYETLLGTARQALSDGKKPEEIVGMLRGHYKGNKDLLNVPFKEQDKEMLRVAQALAEDGQLDTVKAILESPRTGDDGTKLGALKDNRDFTLDASRILAQAERKRNDKNLEAGVDARAGFYDAAKDGTLDRGKLEAYAKENPGSLSEAQVRQIVDRNDAAREAVLRLQEKEKAKTAARQSEDRLTSHDVMAGDEGMLPFVEDGKVLTESGETKTVSAEQRRENATKAQMDREDTRLIKLREELIKVGDKDVDGKVQAAGKEAFNAKVDWLTRNGQTNPQWESVLKSGYLAAARPTTSGGPVPPALNEAVDLYEELHAKNPRLLKSHMKDATAMEFYEAVRLSEQYAGMDRNEAFANAITATRDPEVTNSVSYRQRYDDLKQAVASTSGWLNGRSRPSNFTYAQNEIEKLGSFYLKLGLGGEDALSEASKAYEARHTQINGFDVYTGDRGVPPDFKSLVQSSLKSYVRDFGEREGFDDDGDLTIAPSGTATGAWLIVDRRTGMPVANAGRRNLTLNGMKDALATDAIRAAGEKKERGKAIVHRALNPPAPSSPLSGIKSWFQRNFDASKVPDEFSNPMQ
jgi:hypothetical protein